MPHCFAMTEWNRDPLILVVTATGLLFLEVIVLAWRRNATAALDASGQQKVVRRSRWLPILFGVICYLGFMVGLALMHLPLIKTMMLGDQKPFDQSRAKLIIEELKQNESDKVRLLMLKELEVIIEDPAKE